MHQMQGPLPQGSRHGYLQTSSCDCFLGLEAVKP
jgi:hypothetical protein